MASFIKDPDATLDFVFDWSDWLATGETIASQDVTVEDGLTKGSVTESSGQVTVRLSGGTVNTRYSVACKITTSSGQIDERTMSILVKNR